MPSLLTRVSDFIPEITDYIDKIHHNGMAYTTNGSVYFDTQAFRWLTHPPSTGRARSGLLMHLAAEHRGSSCQDLACVTHQVPHQGRQDSR